MSRQWRIEYPGAIYHVMSRGNGGQAIFRSKDDRHTFLGLLEEVTERFAIEVHGYVLMDNHYHLMLKTRSANLSRAMQWLGTGYTLKFNINHHTSGHLFQGRFKSILVENDAYLLRLSLYIHKNPLKAGLVRRLADYPWSSYRYYAYAKKPPEWLTTRAILNQLSAKDVHRAYRNRIQRYSDEQGSVLEDLKLGFILGSQDFVADLKERFLKESRDKELPQHNRLMGPLDPSALTRTAAAVLDLDLDTVLKARRIAPGAKDKRDMLVYLLWKTGGMTNQTIGEQLGVSYSAVSKIVPVFKERLAREGDLRRRFTLLCEQLGD